MAEMLEDTPDMRREPMDSTRACSTASNTARAAWPSGASRRCRAESWQASRRAMESALPRRIATSCTVSRRGGSGRRALSWPMSAGRSDANVTSRSGLRAMAFMVPAMERFSGSAGASFLSPGLRFEMDIDFLCSSSRPEHREEPGSPVAAKLPYDPGPRPWRVRDGALRQHHVDGAFRQLLAEGALVELRHQGALQLVALVEEGDPEGEARVAEDLGVLGPGDHRARAHDRGEVAVHEGAAGHVGHAHHLVDDVPARGIRLVVLGLGEDDVHLLVVRQVVEGGDDGPAVHLALVDLLRAVIEARGVAQAHRVGGGEQPEARVGPDHPPLVEEGELAGLLQHA